MSWLQCTQVLSETSTQSDTSSQNNSDIVGILTIFEIDYRILRGETKIGRNPEVCSIVLENKTLSKVHAVIESEGPDDSFIYDVGSTNKTKIGKSELKPNVRYKLNDEDMVTFGNVKAKFKIYRDRNDSGSQSLLLSPIRSSEAISGSSNRSEVFVDSPDINDSIFEAATQCNVNDSTPSDHVFKTPQFLKPKRSQARCKIDDINDDIYSLQTQAPAVADECANLNYSDIYNQPTQCQLKTPGKLRSKVKETENLDNLDNSDIFDIQTQCPVKASSDNSIFDQSTQMQIKKSVDDEDDFIFEEETQRPVKEMESVLDDTVFEEETQVPGFKNKKIPDQIVDAETQKAKYSESVFDVETQGPAKEKESLIDDTVFEEETQISINGFSKNETIFETETQVPGISNKNKISDSVFDAETQQTGKGLSSLNLDDSESYLFGAETQFPQKKENLNDSNEIIGSLPDSIFQETTQIPEKNPQSEKKRKRPLKHDNVALFKGKRKSAEDAKDYLNDGEDDMLCEFMSQNSPVFNIKEKKENEKDGFDEDINLEEIPSHVFDPDTQTPGYDKRRSHLDSGIADEKDNEELTQSLSLNETVNDSGVKDKEDSIASKVKGSVNMVLSSSSDEECDNAIDNGSKSSQNHNFKVPDTRTFEDSIPTQVLPTNNIVNQQISSASQVKRQLEDEIPTQVLNDKQNEDITPTQPFNKTEVNEDSVPTQIFNNQRVVESSDDETDSDIELPIKKVVESSGTESDVESVKVNELDRIETPTSVGSNSMLNADDKSNDSFSMVKDIEENSWSKSPNLLGEPTAICNSLSPNDKFLKAPEGENVAICEINKRGLSPTQIMFEDEEIDKSENKTTCPPTQVTFEVENNAVNKNEEVLRRSNCSPTQVMSDSDTDCEESVTNIKSEPKYEDTQVLPLSPPDNYKPRVLTEEDAWMLGSEPKEINFKSPEKVDQLKKSNRDNDSDDDWAPLSLELPSTQAFEEAVKEREKRNTPEKPIPCSKRPRDSNEDTIKPKTKLLKNDDSLTFKAPGNLVNGENTIEPKQSEVKQSEIISEGRPQRTKSATWKVKLNEASNEEKSPVIKIKRKSCETKDETFEESDSPLIKLPKRTGRQKPLVIEDEQDAEPEKPTRRSARLRKSGSTSSCNSSSSLESANPSRNKRTTRNNKKKSYFEDEDVKVVFTSYVNDNKSQMIKRLGGEQVADVKDANIVVTDKVRRTVKFLSALALGLPIVTPDWILKCNEEDEFLDPWPYLLQDKDQEFKFKFNLKKSIEKAMKKKLLQGFKVSATPKAKPPPEELYVIVEHCGGEPLRDTPDIWPDKTIIISCPEDESHWPSVKYRYVKIVHFEFLLTGVLQQKLDFKTYKLR